MRGVVIGSVCSGSGKTVIVSGLLRVLRGRGMGVSSGKVGPDYIDPSFHQLASGRASLSCDLWALGNKRFSAMLAEEAASGSSHLVVEGVMGLFDKGRGCSTAEVAAHLDCPVVLVVDVSAMAESVVALVDGFRMRAERMGVAVAGVILNRVGGARHRELLRTALAEANVTIYGMVPRHEAMTLPHRLLGLVPAWEHRDNETMIERVADTVRDHIDIDGLLALMQPIAHGQHGSGQTDVLFGGQRLAVAYDDAFCFVYGWMRQMWQKSGRGGVSFFSPLADEAPPVDADVVFLPGGYPERYGATLAGNGRFLAGLRACARGGAFIYGECGGFMTLGEELCDKEGRWHAMAGLLPLRTSMEKPQLALAYRQVRCARAMPIGAQGTLWRGHEFHYAQITDTGTQQGLFVDDATGETLGLMQGSVAGSFVHLIAQKEQEGAQEGVK